MWYRFIIFSKIGPEVQATLKKKQMHLFPLPSLSPIQSYTALPDSNKDCKIIQI